MLIQNEETMKNLKIYLLLIVFITLTISCSNDNEIEPAIENLKSVTDCEITIVPDLLVSICIDGTDSALPNETIKFTSTFYSKNGNPSNTEFLWTIESGSMEIINIENSTDRLIAKSIATIKFNSDYSGNGIISANAENNSGNGRLGNCKHLVGLENN
jgi:hypothetical protein